MEQIQVWFKLATVSVSLLSYRESADQYTLYSPPDILRGLIANSLTWEYDLSGAHMLLCYPQAGSGG